MILGPSGGWLLFSRRRRSSPFPSSPSSPPSLSPLTSAPTMLVRLPASIQMAPLDLRASLPHFQVHFPSPTSLFLVLLVSVVVLAALRAALLFVRPHPQPEQKNIVSVPQQPVELQEKKQPIQEQRPKSSWAWGLITWDSLPALPLSLSTSTPGRDMRGRGVGLASKQPQQQMQQAWQQQQQRRGPAFERPLPAMYQTEVPASMAKMIMSRHTFRRPTSRPPPRPSTPVPQIQIQRRSPSMV